MSYEDQALGGAGAGSCEPQLGAVSLSWELGALSLPPYESMHGRVWEHVLQRKFRTWRIDCNHADAP